MDEGPSASRESRRPVTRGRPRRRASQILVPQPDIAAAHQNRLIRRMLMYAKRTGGLSRYFLLNPFLLHRTIQSAP